MQEEDLLIAVDGGLDYCGILGIEPDLILGDFDSVSGQAEEKVNALENRIFFQCIFHIAYGDASRLLHQGKQRKHSLQVLLEMHRFIDNYIPDSGACCPAAQGKRRYGYAGSLESSPMNSLLMPTGKSFATTAFSNVYFILRMVTP